ncbi:MAG: hypothetical protein U1F35_00235 [Steroidobacteraceae bacterium]
MAAARGGLAAAVVTLAGFAVPCWADADLEAVVVTAQRRAENVQDVPIAISAFTANDLERTNIRQAGDITTLVPNLLLSSPYGEEAEPVFSLRGVTSNDFSQNQSAPVAMYVDEVYRSVGRRRCRPSTWSASRCCAGRRARSTARIPLVAPSVSSRATRT